MKDRLGSIDFFRGLCLIMMIHGHTGLWRLTPASFSMMRAFFDLADSMTYAGFLFISGLSLQLFYQKKVINAREKDPSTFDFKSIRFGYFLRAILYLIVIVNPFFIILVASMMVGWFLYKYSIRIKLIICFTLLFIVFFNQNLEFFLYPNGILTPVVSYFDQINPWISNLIIIFIRQFPIFLLGSFIGDLISKKVLSKKIMLENNDFLKQITLPLFIGGLLLLLFSIFIIPPGILMEGKISWILFSMGVHLTIFSMLITIEGLDLIVINNKYRFVFYFSYYSLTIFIIQFYFYEFFYQRLLPLQFYPIIITIILIIGLILKTIHYFTNGLFSIKYLIGKWVEKLYIELLEAYKKLKNP